MGPPPFGDGNTSNPVAIGSAFVHLQWGHRLSAMETRESHNKYVHGEVAFNGATAFRRWKRESPILSTYTVRWPSMGPPPFGDGNLNRCCHSSASNYSFNGATAFRRWKRGPSGNGRTWSFNLQWGHRLSAMETSSSSSSSRREITLQWGHRLSAMETSQMEA